MISGNWLGIGPVEFANTGNYNFAGNFNPYTKAPLTGHVVWANHSFQDLQEVKWAENSAATQKATSTQASSTNPNLHQS